MNEETKKEYIESIKALYLKYKKEHDERKTERNKIFLNNLDWEIINYRIDHNLTREEVEKKLNISILTLQRWANGNEKISRSQFNELHRILGLKKMYLFNSNDHRQCAYCKILIDDYPTNYGYCNYCFLTYNPLNFSNIFEMDTILKTTKNHEDDFN